MDEASKLSGGSTEIDLRGIREGTHPVVLEGGETPLSLGRTAGRILRQFRFEGSLEWMSEDRRVRGFLSGILETRCDRCLSSFDRDMRSRIDVRVRIVRPAPRAGPADDAKAETEGAPPEGEVILSTAAVELDLAETFGQAALLEVPIKNVCRDDCRGICVSCGVNLNEESCPHAEDARESSEPRRDPRWNALRGLSFPSETEE